MKFALTLTLLSAACATVTAFPSLHKRRFGQEQIPATIIRKASPLFTNGADSGQISTFAGQSISKVLAAADPCSLYDLGDQMITFGNGKLTGSQLTQYVNIVQQAMAVEKNFNPFSKDPRASICLDATKPASKELRGILPLVDPSLTNAAATNTKTAQINQQIMSGTASTTATGKSVAQQLEAIGFTDIQGTTGGAASGAASSASTAAASTAAATQAAAASSATQATAAAATQASTAAATSSGSSASGQAIDAMIADLTKLRALFDGSSSSSPASGSTDNVVAAASSSAAPASTDAASAAATTAAAASATAASSATTSAAAAASTGAATAAATAGNLQTFTGSLGGVTAPAVTNDGSNRPFKVDNNANFLTLQTALVRSCDVQFNKCQNVFNSPAKNSGLKQGDCANQQTQCNAAINNAASASSTAAATTSAAADASAAATTTAAAATSAAAATTSAAAAAATTAAAATGASGSNLQTFTGSLGGVTAPAVTNDGSSRPFAVANNANFPDVKEALIRSCDVQFNKCQNVFNSPAKNSGLKQGDCANQQTQCNAAAGGK